MWEFPLQITKYVNVHHKMSHRKLESLQRKQQKRQQQQKQQQQQQKRNINKETPPLNHLIEFKTDSVILIF